MPSITGNAAKATEIVVIWGGASSMGSVGIQLALASGYKVVTTVSAKNVDFVKSLATPADGADSITTFDSYADDAVSQITSHIKSSGSKLAGVFDSISLPSTIAACFKIQHELSGAGKIAVVLPVPGDDSFSALPGGEKMSVPTGVTGELVYAVNPGLVPGHPGAEIWRDFVPAALENGRLKAEPQAMVVGEGLDKLQKALDIQKAGVSAKKVVVKL